MATYDSDSEVNNVNGQMQNERPDPVFSRVLIFNSELPNAS